MATYSLYTGSGPSLVSYSGPFQSGIAFQVTTGGCWFLGYRWWVPAGGDTAAQKFALWCITVNAATGNTLVSGSVITSGTLTANAWNLVTLATPLQLAPGAAYIAATGWTAVHGFPDTNNQFASGDPFSAGITSGPLFAYSDVANGGSGTQIPPGIGAQGQFSANAGATDPSVYMPVGSSNSANFGMDVQVSDTAPSGYSGSYRMWPNFPSVAQQNNNMVDLNDAYILGTEFTLPSACTLNNIWFYSPPTATSLPTQCAIWDVSTQAMVSGTLKTSPGWSGAAGSGWVSASYSGVTLPAGDYKASVWNATASGSGVGWNAYTPAYFTTGAGAANLVAGPVTIPDVANATTPGQCTYQISSSAFAWPSLYVSTGTPGQNYWVDAEVTPAAAGAATAAGALSVSGTAAGRAPAAAAAAVTLAGTAAAAGAAGATGSVAVAGTSAGKAPVTATGALAVSGSAAAVALVSAAGTATLAGTASATGPGVTAAGAVAVTGTASGAAPAPAAGSVTVAGTATARAAAAPAGNLVLSGAATASAPAAAAGGADLTGTAAASGPGITASAALALAGMAAAQAPAVATGAFSLAGTAAPRAAATAAGTVTITGTALFLPPFTVGTLTASDSPGAGGTLTASDTRTGGPS